ncbi:hypothetical protein DXG01_016402 [Tephrocybe rancida]|nr:hypothetical protein DXG01_016402 [Tephrocybe rancida]
MGLETFITHTLGLTELPPHLPTFAVAFVGFTFVHLVLAPWASKRWFATTYGAMGKRARNAWSIHIVSQIHALLIVPLALWVISHQQKAAYQGPENARARAFGWDGRVGLDAIVNFADIGFVLHGFPDTNGRRFMDKTGRTGTRAQLVNGVLLLAAFFGVRLVYGGMVSYQFLHTLMQVRHEMSWAYLTVYGTGNALLTSLNWFWFYKMISALRRRFTDEKDPERRRLVGVNGNGHDNADNERTVTNEDSAEEGAYRTQN